MYYPKQKQPFSYQLIRGNCFNLFYPKPQLKGKSADGDDCNNGLNQGIYGQKIVWFSSFGLCILLSLFNRSQSNDQSYWKANIRSANAANGCSANLYQVPPMIPTSLTTTSVVLELNFSPLRAHEQWKCKESNAQNFSGNKQSQVNRGHEFVSMCG